MTDKHCDASSVASVPCTRDDVGGWPMLRIQHSDGNNPEVAEVAQA